MKLIVKTLTDDAIIPTYGSVDAAGLDLYASSDYLILPNTRDCISTGIAIEWARSNEFQDKFQDKFQDEFQDKFQDENPENFYMRIAPRSGLAYKHGIDVGAGVIDFGYRGEIKVILFNHGDNEFIIKKGDRIAQAILTRIIRFSEIITSDTLSDTQRGSGGFGSTGTR